MIPFCAKQGVEQKISFEDFLSAMLSDYECAYACGMAAAKLGVAISKEMPLTEIKAAVEAAMPEDKPQDYRERNLYQLIRDYELKGFEEVPEEIAVLVEMGLKAEIV
ncbi:MAG: DUF3837 family protein [Lachnospiraceae bacterium]|nr:DUF3837 family protein [Lachnospiraceae bacterium]